MKTTKKKVNELIANKQSFMVTSNSENGSELFVIENGITYDEAREFIGGWIEKVGYPICKSDEYSLYVDEDGLNKELEPNDFATTLIDFRKNGFMPIFGNAIVAFGQVIKE